jgi:putative Mn2+ efflux pump MntP
METYDHWIAFGLLGLIGGKMIKDSFNDDCEMPKSNPLKLFVLLGLSVATSIDALAAGVSFGVLEINIFMVIAIIGLITFVLSILGCHFGVRLGCRFGNRVEFIGGIILIGIGLKILIEHLQNHI